MCNDKINRPSLLFLAMLGPETLDEAISTSTMLSSLPEEQRIPQVLFSTPSSILTDKTKYRNLLRVIESDESQTKVHILYVS